MIKIENFHPSHLINFQPKFGIEKEFIQEICSGTSITAFTITSREAVICFLGFVEVRDGVLEVHIALGKGVDHFCFGLVKVFNKLMQVLKDSGNYFRLQATVLKGFAPGIRLLKFFGFVEEGLMKGYTKMGEDYFIYGRAI
jgi:RimJ/RimL family protein N-acetyltransferase